MIYKINGRTVTEEEYAEFCRRRQGMLEAAGFSWENLRFAIVGDDGENGYMTGKKNSEDLGAMHPMFRKLATDAAKKAGVSLQGKRHVCQLGPPEDPSSWVESYDDLVNKAAAKGKTVEPSNSLRKKHRAEVVPPKRVRLAPKHVQRMIAKELAADPSLAEKKSRDELAEMVTDKYGGGAG